jgi:hypothetical protein
MSDDEYEIEVRDEEDELEDTQALMAVNAIMDRLGPGFVLIASPHFHISEETGYPMPDDIAIGINPNLNLTPSVVIQVLKHLILEMENQLDDKFDRLAND